ncbi:MAG: tyrosine-type recombinase/integrase, partial [Candidatus Krumholzibacteria bacterium]|nr:tyrosine-type recombinase/integrase [Candidatus Krumholzibacteria bacterium]
VRYYLIALPVRACIEGDYFNEEVAMKITQTIRAFLDCLQQEGRSHNTVAAYERDLRAFVLFTGDVNIESVTPELLLRFMATRGVQFAPCGARRAKSTVNRYRVALKALFAWCEARWLIPRNPTAILKCRRHRAVPPVVLTEAEIERVLTHRFAEPHAARDRALVSFMLLTGCRLGETIGLDVADIDLERGTATLRHRKGGEPDQVYLQDAIIDVLRSYIQRSDPGRPLYTSSGNRRISARQTQRIVARRIRETGVRKRVSPHTLRHTFATLLYNRTGDIRLVQQALRHGHVTTTEAYAQVDPQRWREAVEFFATMP